MQPLEDVASDNTAGAHPAVLAAVVAANEGRTASYGDDPWTAHAMQLVRDRLGAVAAAPVLTGSAANVLSLQLVVRPHEAVICAHTAHIETDECGAPERYLGCKLLPVVTPDGKLTPALVASRVRDIGDPHRVQVRAVSISQPTELGTLYTRESCMRSPRRLARTDSRCTSTGRGCRWPLRHSGARSPRPRAHPTSTCVSFGGTKCGALAAESVVVYREGLADALAYQRKQAMQLASKLRFVGAQYVALLEHDLWRELATTANSDGRAHGGGALADSRRSRSRSRSRRTRSSRAFRRQRATSSPRATRSVSGRASSLAS